MEIDRNEMNMWPLQLYHNFQKAIAKWLEKKVFGASTGFEPVASVFALRCSSS